MEGLEVRGDTIVKSDSGKVVSIIVDGKVNPTSPYYGRKEIKDQLQEMVDVPELIPFSDPAPTDGPPPDIQEEPPRGPLGDRTPEVIEWRRTNLTEERFNELYRGRAIYKV